jgi:general nucleoside transport system permease protein
MSAKGTPRTRSWAQALRVVLVFAVLSSGFFLLIGRHPGTMLVEIVSSAAGSGYALGESLLRATPILLCALATLVPARLGLISVGAEGQLYLGAITGTGVMLVWTGPAPLLLPAVLLGGMVGGALWALLPAVLRNLAAVHETIATLMLNHVAALAVTWLVYGPWKNPQSQGWPATIEFPDAARLPTLADSRLHVGLLIALALALLLHVLLDRTRWGLALDVLRSNPRLEHVTGLRITRQVVLTMAIGGALAGLAGIAEASVVQGRLQSDLSQGAGLSGFLVAWLAGGRVLRAVWMSLLVGGLLASGDGLQMNAQVPSSVTLVIQGLLFVAVLGAGTRWWPTRWTLRGRHV